MTFWLIELARLGCAVAVAIALMAVMAGAIG